MGRVNKHNYLHVLDDTLAALVAVNKVLHQNRQENRQEINSVSAAIKHIQSIVRVNRQKKIKTKQRKHEEERVRKAEELLKKLKDNGGSGATN